MLASRHLRILLMKFASEVADQSPKPIKGELRLAYRDKHWNKLLTGPAFSTVAQEVVLSN